MTLIALMINKSLPTMGLAMVLFGWLATARNVRNLVLMYRTLFNTSLIDMIYFDANGVMQDMNDRACESLLVKDKQALLDAKRTTLDDMPSLQDIDFNTLDKRYSTSCTKVEDIKQPMGDFEEGQDSVYYEQYVTTIRDHQGQLSGWC